MAKTYSKVESYSITYLTGWDVGKTVAIVMGTVVIS